MGPTGHHDRERQFLQATGGFLAEGERMLSRLNNRCQQSNPVIKQCLHPALPSLQAGSTRPGRNCELGYASHKLGQFGKSPIYPKDASCCDLTGPQSHVCLELQLAAGKARVGAGGAGVTAEHLKRGPMFRCQHSCKQSGLVSHTPGTFAVCLGQWMG